MGALLLCGCGAGKEPDEVRSIRAYYLPLDATSNPSVLTQSAKIQLDALGDFEPSVRTSEAARDDAVGVDLPFPLSTRGVEAKAESGQSRWSGLGLAGGDGNIGFALWPVRDGCALWEPSAAGFPPQAVGAAFGYLPEERSLLLVGSDYDLAESRVAVIDVTTGKAFETDGLPSSLAYASVTAFGRHKWLIAGGIDPTGLVAPGDTAQVFDATSEKLEANSITLKQIRSHHTAIALASGETLLVGGMDLEKKPLTSLETVSPKTRTAKNEGLANPKFARVRPAVLRLDNDEIFVAGGYAGPSSGDPPISGIEWFSPDAKTTVRSLGDPSIHVARAHAFVAMPGGGVLAVGLCVAKSVTDPCATNLDDYQSRSVTWIGPGGELHVLPNLLPPVTFARLVPGSDGEPWLFVVTKNPVQESWFRFNPWTGSFEIPENEPSSGPISIRDPNQTLPDTPLALPLSIDPGLFVWLEQREEVTGNRPRLVGFRFDTRSELARHVGPLLKSDTSHMVPSVPPANLDPSSPISAGVPLELTGESAVVTVADATYANVDVTIEFDQSEPIVIFGGAHRFGGPECAWPDETAENSGDPLILSRRGTSVTLRRGKASRTCSVGSGRFPFALAGFEWRGGDGALARDHSALALEELPEEPLVLVRGAHRVESDLTCGVVVPGIVIGDPFEIASWTLRCGQRA